MKIQWTESEVESLAPDSGSLQRGRGLAIGHKWLSLKVDSRAIWGECKGSGKNPYRTGIDFNGPAFKCNCPSRKFPCKHGVGLFLLYVNEPSLFSVGSHPEWLDEWLKKRAEKLAAAEANKPTPDQEAKQKREEARLSFIRDGVKELRQWLFDAIRLGTAELYQQDAEYWSERRGRLDDAKAPGLSNAIKQLQETFRLPDWQNRSLEELGNLYLLTQTFEHIDQLNPNMQAEIKNLVGINVKKEEVLAQNGIRDLWQVLGKKMEIHDRLDVQRTWLAGAKTGKIALIIDFAFGNRGFENNFIPGTALEGEIVYYPGSLQTRALLRDKPERIHKINDVTGWPTLADFFKLYAHSLGTNPFLFQFPFLVNDLRPLPVNDKWLLIDKNDQTIPLHPQFHKVWELMAVSGQEPITIFGEWSGKNLMPLGAMREGSWVAF